MSLQWHAIRAIFKRNFISYFSNPIGYLFITAFVWASAYFAFWHNDAFFANNLADLDQLNAYFPYLLLFFVPAITMTVWAEERKTGTEELLLTLPASDLEIVLGKYLSCLGIYTVALLFSISHVFVLRYLGAPDRGLMFSTYLGYWLIGAALLSAGMMASLFTNNVTIAFIWGVAVCLVLATIHQVGMIAGGVLRDLLEKVSVAQQFEPFGNGLVSLGGLLYFISIIAIMLYMNIVLLSRRHWGGSREAPEQWTHSLVRALSLGTAAVSLTVLVGRADAYLSVDVTEERLHKLSPDTVRILEDIDPNQPVFIEAFVSPRVPRAYVETRRNLLDLLRQYDALGGNRVEVAIHETELFSEEARDAERVYEIKAETVPTMEDGRFGRDEIFLGVAFTSGLNQKTVPFFYQGLPVEYELTRSIRTVSQKAPRKVGVLTTDAQLYGQFNFQMMRPPRNWLIVNELQQQYAVEQVSPDSEITAEVDVLVVPMASSLTQTQMDNLIDYIEAGKPTLIFDDPMPFINPQLAALEQKPSPQRNPMMGGQPPPTPKGNLRDLTDLLNIEFDAGSVVWQDWNPHPQFKDLPPEYVFVGAGSGAREPFNLKEAITSGLQEMVLIYPGGIRPKGGDGPEFTPLLSCSTASGTTPWNDVFTQNFMFRAVNPYPRRRGSFGEFVLAGYIHGPLKAKNSDPKKDDQDKGEKKDEEAAKDEGPKDANVIFIADLDLVSDAFFELRRQGEENLHFDNVTFVLNCVDVLAGDDAFVQLRKKRPKRRTLTRIADMTRDVKIAAREQQDAAEQEADKALQKAQKELDDAVDKIRNNKELDRRTKEVLAQNERRTQQRKFDVAKAEIEAQKQEQVKEIETELQRSVRAVQRRIKLLAVLLPPIPALLIGIAVFFARLAGEKEGVDPKRMV